ncbi:signal peptide-containing protein [Theileria equi strain WA]|uniref:thioredoxin-dependent peroxiredoxin n=1 Tax=Theileria equi strain WA TaxID=1537102 RepID=L0AZF4_THEEQ|nr:signal peptide-containing protein [Theileria equi strain WA]AFZ80376.1 signal peptide-containing protein [Theileria equi strain WA]|eukprot:XP_004830042.1 signal peptide-containing protein [Theileria equi strain WA]
MVKLCVNVLYFALVLKIITCVCSLSVHTPCDVIKILSRDLPLDTRHRRTILPFSDPGKSSFISTMSNSESDYVGSVIPDTVLEETLATEGSDTTSLKAILSKLPSDYKGIVLFLFPSVGTPYCTKQACNFAQSHKSFNDLGYQVYGLTASRKAIASSWSKRNQLTYTILFDQNSKIVKYLKCTWMYFLINRSHIVIGKDARILAFERGVNAEKSSSRVLDLIKGLK